MKQEALFIFQGNLSFSIWQQIKPADATARDGRMKRRSSYAVDFYRQHRGRQWSTLEQASTENFNCNSVSRRDPYIDFSFSDSNNSGPLRGSQGFSAAWQASLDGGLLSTITLDYEVQGHARVFIDGKPQGGWINSEDSVSAGTTRPTWHVGDNTFVVQLWQAPGKPARLRMTVEERGLIAEAKVFESQGTLTSSAYQPLPPAEFANFEPPPVPGEESSLPGIPPDLGKSWDNLISGLEQALDRWWQNLSEQMRQRIQDWLQRALDRLLKNFEDALVEGFYDLLEAMEQQCVSIFVLVAGMGLVVVAGKRRGFP